MPYAVGSMRLELLCAGCLLPTAYRLLLYNSPP